jgi:ABC-type branched-subunit amino acid transport system permease subunit
VLVLLREYLRGFPGLSELIYGVALLVVVLFFSKGIYGAIASRWRTVREGAL